MASPDTDSSWSSTAGETFCGYFNLQLEEADPGDISPALESLTPSSSNNSTIPKPPSPPVKTFSRSNHARLPDCSSVPKETKHTWDRLFMDGYGADVYIFVEENSYIMAHSSILSAASPVLCNIMHQPTVRNGTKYIRIPGVPDEAVQAFIRFLYSSCYEEETMKKYVLHLLILSHCYSVPSLKRVCTHYLEYHWLTKENVVDVLQLARYCDAPRLSLFCIRMVLKDFKSISLTEGWKIMKLAHPALEQELLEAVVEVDSRKQERLRKMEERQVYLQLYEAMEALLHICRDGCRTIGPRDKLLKVSQPACGFPACKGLESLVRHFASCVVRVPGGCVHCKRMWQLLELHSRMCTMPDDCKVPLCRSFNLQQSMQNQEETLTEHSARNQSSGGFIIQPQMLRCMQIRYGHLLVSDFSDSMASISPENMQQFMGKPGMGGGMHVQDQVANPAGGAHVVRNVADRRALAVLFESILPWVNYGGEDGGRGKDADRFNANARDNAD